MAVAGELDAIGQPRLQIRNKRNGGVRIASAKQPANQKLGISADRRPRPNVASGRRRGLRLRYVAVLGVNERPDFIHLDPLARQVAERLVLIGGAGMTGLNQKFGYRIFATSRKSGYGADRLPLTKEMKDLGAGLS